MNLRPKPSRAVAENFKTFGAGCLGIVVALVFAIALTVAWRWAR